MALVKQFKCFATRMVKQNIFLSQIYKENNISLQLKYLNIHTGTATRGAGCRN